MSGAPPIRPDILAMPDADWGLSTVEDIAARQGLGAERIIKLDSNENLYGPSPRVAAVLAAGADWQLYPDALYRDLRRALAHYAGVTPDNIIVSNGGDELISLVTQLTVAPGDEIINCPPTFSVYDWAAAMHFGRLVAVPRRREAGYALDMAGVRQALTERTRLIIVCNPNNPTGGLTPQEDIVALLDSGVMLLLDEAYYEFCGMTLAPLVHRYPNLVILRTMSKWAALAGLRVGYGIVSDGLLAQINKLRMPFNVSLAGCAAALAALADTAYALDNVRRMVDERARLYACLQEIPFLTPYPSHGSFVTADVTKGDARLLRDEVERDGVALRLFQNTYLPNAIRVSVGKPEHTEAAIAALHRAGQRLGLT